MLLHTGKCLDFETPVFDLKGSLMKPIGSLKKPFQFLSFNWPPFLLLSSLPHISIE